MASLRKAINDKCRDCIYDPQIPGTCLDQISTCHIKDCPLWPVRPRKPLSDVGEAHLRYAQEMGWNLNTAPIRASGRHKQEHSDIASEIQVPSTAEGIS